jgi:penicillin-binding protein 1C
MRDNWCIGFTSRYTVGVWVGNFSGAPMRDVSGVTGAAPIWREIVHRLHTGDASSRPAAPSGLSRTPVWFEPPVEPERKEWFLIGTEMTVVERSGSESAGPRIRYPAADAIIALDPDIPPDAQRVVFQASRSASGLRWRLDGASLGEADVYGRFDWCPARGRHTLELQDAEGRILSATAFEVRGNAAR